MRLDTNRRGLSTVVIGVIVIIIVAGVGAGIYFATAGSGSSPSTTQAPAQSSTQSSAVHSTTQASSQAVSTTQSTSGTGAPSNAILSAYDLFGNFSSVTIHFRENSSTDGTGGGTFWNATLAVIGTPTVDGAKGYELNVTYSAGSPPSENPPVVLVINSTSEVTSASSQGQNYTGGEAASLGGALLGFVQDVSSGNAQLYYSINSQGSTSTETIGSVQFQTVTYSFTVTQSGYQYSYVVKVGTPQGHQFGLFTEVGFDISQGAGYETSMVTCASLYGQPLCPSS